MDRWALHHPTHYPLAVLVNGRGAALVGAAAGAGALRGAKALFGAEAAERARGFGRAHATSKAVVAQCTSF